MSDLSQLYALFLSELSLPIVKMSSEYIFSFNFLLSLLLLNSDESTKIINDFKVICYICYFWQTSSICILQQKIDAYNLTCTHPFLRPSG